MDGSAKLSVHATEAKFGRYRLKIDNELALERDVEFTDHTGILQREEAIKWFDNASPVLSRLGAE